MAEYNFNRSVAPVKTVAKIKFSIMDPKEIKEMSVIDSGHFPFDPRQGAILDKSLCQNCKEDFHRCPGHFGNIKLERPVFFSHYKRKIVSILKSICFHCSNLLVDMNNMEFANMIMSTSIDKKERLAIVEKLCKRSTVCNLECGMAQPIIFLTKLELIAKWRSTGRRRLVLTANHVLQILSKMSDQTIDYLGMDPKFSRPEWMICTQVPVLPISCRPLASSTINKDYLEILNSNNLLKRHIEELKSEEEITKDVKSLQMNVDRLFDNILIENDERGGMKDLLIKNVDFTAISVVTPDPMLEIDQIGIPRSIGQNMTFPEVVSEYNISRLSELIARGANYPSAMYFIDCDGGRFNLRVVQEKCKVPQILPGYKVERHLNDDDVVVVRTNKMSPHMLSHRIKLLPGSTIRLNPSVLAAYVADYCCDKIGLHFPQSLETSVEVNQLASVKQKLFSPCFYGMVEDSLLAARKMTSRDTFIEKGDLMNLLMHLSNWNGKMTQPAILKPKELWTGKQIISMILPGEFNFFDRPYNISGEQYWCPVDDSNVLIDGGGIAFGTLSRRHLGSCCGSLFEKICLDNGLEKAVEVLNDIQFVVDQWLLLVGQSIGVADFILDDDFSRSVQTLVENSKMLSDKLIQRAFRGKLISVAKETHRQRMEMKIEKFLDTMTSNTNKILINRLPRSNNCLMMAASGSSGSLNNIRQTVAYVGQQKIGGERIPFGFKKRTLPHFLKSDSSLLSRGFIANSFMAGLRPTEFFFQAMEGRDKLIINNLCIPKMTRSNIQRPLIKTMENIMVKYDGTVRNQQDNVIQFVYGGDGLDGERIEHQTCKIMSMSDLDFETDYKIDFSNSNLMKFLDEDVPKDLYLETVTDSINRDFLELGENRKTLQQKFTAEYDKVSLPFNLSRMIITAQKKFKFDKKKMEILSPIKIIQDLDGLSKKLKVIYGNDVLSIQSNSMSTLHVNVITKSMLSPNRVIDQLNLSSEAFDWLTSEVERRFMQSQVQPGEMVGIKAARYLYNLTNQMISKTCCNINPIEKTAGSQVQRLKEILALPNTDSNPSMTIYFENGVSRDDARDVANSIEYATMKNIISKVSICYETSRSPVPYLKLSNWWLKLHLDTKKMADMKISLHTIRQIMKRFTSLHCSVSTKILRIRLIISYKKKELNKIIKEIPEYDVLRNYERHILSERLKGFSSIRKVNLLQIISQPSNEKSKPFKEWVLITEGSMSLSKIFSMKNVDHKRTVTNDLSQILEVLGIEATKKALENQLKLILDADKGHAIHRHFSLLCDIMTSRGILEAVGRHGISKDLAPLAACCYDKTANDLVDAAAHAKCDPLMGVAESATLGKLAKIGTGSFDLFYKDFQDQKILSEELQMMNNLTSMEGSVNSFLSCGL